MQVGLDVGTANLVSAKLNGKKIETQRIRNAFVELSDDEQRNRLGVSGLNAVHLGARSYVVGDEAIAIARILNKEVRRPMASGVLNPEEKDGRAVLGALIKALVGEAEEGSHCCFSVPSQPLDNPKAGTVWHTGFFTGLLERLGFEAEPVNEALAIIYAECAKDDHCGIALSHGAGQVNACASYKLVGSVQFSISKSGDWIDSSSAAAVGVNTAKILKVKEDPNFDLAKAQNGDEIEEAIYFHYRSMIHNELKHLIQQWKVMDAQLNFPNPIPIVLSGGTAAVKGFRDLWEDEFQKVKQKTTLPFEVSEIRMAADPFGAVAKGLLIYGLSKKT